jgi:hypothetical protein
MGGWYTEGMILGWLAVVGLVVLLGLAVMIALHLVVANVNAVRSPLSVPTPMVVLPEVLKALDMPAGGMLVEPGCGDGRVLAAVLRQDVTVRVLGVENDPVMLAVAWLRAGRKARLVLGDMRTMPLGEADRVFAYLSPRFMELLEAKFERELKRGSRVVSLQFALPGRRPSRVVELEHGPAHAHRLYVYDY